ncbi:DegT/DnrJ/EryC1/StrS aminotransferase family protein [Amylibacter sp.]|nr:DegT/DnrJ/EryC1/StrS aminotransferase family protein [Amylibacter sp.]
MQFIDLAAQQARIRDRIDTRIATVLDHGKYIMGPEVAELEADLSAFCGANHSLTCANGTDALLLALMAFKVRTGDAVFCPTFTFAATAEVVPSLGAVPVFVDCDPDTYNMDPASLERAVEHAKALGLRPSVIIAVDLFGLPADYDAIEEIAVSEGMKLIADSAQGFGGVYKGRNAGTIGDFATTSFFPAKPLGCYGDGGALFTEDDELAELVKSYRVHGKGGHKYDNQRIGMNSRLDTLQAAILCEKLAIFGDELKRRNQVADRYDAALSNMLVTPHVPDGLMSSWAQYTVRTEVGEGRDVIMSALEDASVPTTIYYPLPLHQQTAYKGFPTDPNGLLVAERLAQQVFSLPMHPYLTMEDQDKVISALQDALV